MRRIYSPAVTLIEALVVGVILAVVAAFAYQNFWKSAEVARTKGTWAILRLIQGAQLAYDRDVGGFATSLAILMNEGYLDDPMAGQTDWDYTSTDDVKAIAFRTSGSCAGLELRLEYASGLETDTFCNCGIDLPSLPNPCP